MEQRKRGESGEGLRLIQDRDRPTASGSGAYLVAAAAAVAANHGAATGAGMDREESDPAPTSREQRTRRDSSMRILIIFLGKKLYMSPRKSLSASVQRRPWAHPRPIAYRRTTASHCAVLTVHAGRGTARKWILGAVRSSRAIPSARTPARDGIAVASLLSNNCRCVA